MKKKLSCLLMILLTLALTACGKSGLSQEKISYCQQTSMMAYQMMASYGATNLTDLGMNASEQNALLDEMADRDWERLAELVESNSYVYLENGFVFRDALGAWWNVLNEQGSVELASADFATYTVTQTNGTINVQVPLKAGDRTATMEVTMEDDQTVTGIVVNVDYTFGEKMGKAGLNTLLGMGTVFVVLVFIIFVISLFGIIPKLQNRKKKPDVREAAADNTIAQIEKREEEAVDESDDLELVAVISAAIAAYEGSASTDGFVVRSIKKVRRA